jgi:uncharacterized protein (DUF2147 family)
MIAATHRPLFVFLLLALAACAAVAGSETAQAPAAAKPAVLGRWLSESKEGIIEIYAAPDGTLEGKIVGGKFPERRDDKNPDPALRSRLLFGIVIMRGMKVDDAEHWSGGTIYDPDSGNTYRCKMKLAAADRIDLRGFIGFALIGRTSHWTREPAQ